MFQLSVKCCKYINADDNKCFLWATVGEWKCLLCSVMRSGHSKPSEASSNNFPLGPLGSHAPKWFIHQTYTSGHIGFKPTHQHSLGIHSSQVHMCHTPAPHSWESKHTGLLDCTHCQPHQHQHSDTLDEERDGNELLIEEIVTFIYIIIYLICIAL